MTVWIVTDNELGWDCVVGVFSNERAAINCRDNRDINTTYIDKREVEQEYDY